MIFVAGLLTGAFAWIPSGRTSDAEERFRIKYGRSYPSTEQAQNSKEARKRTADKTVVAEKGRSGQSVEDDERRHMPSAED